MVIGTRIGFQLSDVIAFTATDEDDVIHKSNYGLTTYMSMRSKIIKGQFHENRNQGGEN